MRERNRVLPASGTRAIPTKGSSECAERAAITMSRSGYERDPDGGTGAGSVDCGHDGQARFAQMHDEWIEVLFEYVVELRCLVRLDRGKIVSRTESPALSAKHGDAHRGISLGLTKGDKEFVGGFIAIRVEFLGPCYIDIGDGAGDAIGYIVEF